MSTLKDSLLENKSAKMLAGLKTCEIFSKEETLKIVKEINYNLRNAKREINRKQYLSYVESTKLILNF